MNLPSVARPARQRTMLSSPLTLQASPVCLVRAHTTCALVASIVPSDASVILVRLDTMYLYSSVSCSMVVANRPDSRPAHSCAAMLIQSDMALRARPGRIASIAFRIGLTRGLGASLRVLPFRCQRSRTPVASALTSSPMSRYVFPRRIPSTRVSRR